MVDKLIVDNEFDDDLMMSLMTMMTTVMMVSGVTLGGVVWYDYCLFSGSVLLPVGKDVHAS